MKRGINIEPWIASNDLDTTFSMDDLERVAEKGFDHVRILVREQDLWKKPGKPRDSRWAQLQQILSRCREVDLQAILTMHSLTSHEPHCDNNSLFSNRRAPARLAEIWAELSEALRDHPPAVLAYELLNCPTTTEPDQWNIVFPPVYQAIREREPERTVLLGSNLQSPAEIQNLAVPPLDPNLVLCFQYYAPLIVTHFNTPRTQFYNGPVQYPGMPIPQEDFNRLPAALKAKLGSDNRYHDRHVMEADLLWPLAQRAETELNLYCTELGCSYALPEKPRKTWLKDIIEQLEGHGIGWAAYRWKGWASRERSVDPALLELLKPSPQFSD